MAKFGCILPHAITDFGKLVKIAKTCESLGYDSLWAFDHLAPHWTKSKTSLECWTLLSSLAGQTSKIKLGSMVTNINLRHPSLLAKITSTLDVISNGRLILGLGIGDRLSKTELTSFGYNYRSLNERILRLKETIQILNGLWTRNDFSFDGTCYKLHHAHLEPKPRQKPHPPIWIGGMHHRIIDVVAAFADGWNYWSLSEKNPDKIQRLREECMRNNRPFDSIIKSWSGTMPQKASPKTLLEFLREQSHPSTEYFVAHFGPEAHRGNYEIFAKIVRNM